jgi:hypothetical protein
MLRVANKDARSHVMWRKEFQGSNTKGMWIGEEEKSDYGVYSYGRHFPLYIWSRETKQWYGNDDRYSRTTSKHKSQLMPTDKNSITWLNTAQMLRIEHVGVVGFIKEKVSGLTI